MVLQLITCFIINMLLNQYQHNSNIKHLLQRFPMLSICAFNCIQNIQLRTIYSTSALLIITIVLVVAITIFSRQESLTRQAFLITPLHGARYKTEKNAYAKKQCYVTICKINAPSATLVFPTIPLLYAKDQCEALSEGEIARLLYSPAGHILTGDLNIIENQQLRDLISKGHSKYREVNSFRWKYNF